MAAFRYVVGRRALRELVPPYKLAFALLICVVCGSAQARTIVITDEDCEAIAAISAAAPRLGWAGLANAPGQFTNHQIDLTSRSSFLIRYPLERIPPGHRITKAEWTLPHVLVYPVTGVKLNVYRALKPWGVGVSHELRMIRPERVAWSKPGARGVGQDRAARPTASVSVKGTAEATFNVTTDLELWYSGAATNYGWILTIDETDAMVRLHSPFWGAPKGFKLRITFEPE
jgi:hypothetical protein